MSVPGQTAEGAGEPQSPRSSEDVLGMPGVSEAAGTQQ